MGYKKAEATYDGATKTLLIDQARTDFVPSYAYYVCENLEQQNNIEIEFVKFLKTNCRAYTKKELKGKYDWSELK